MRVTRRVCWELVNFGGNSSLMRFEFNIGPVVNKGGEGPKGPVADRETIDSDKRAEIKRRTSPLENLHALCTTRNRASRRVPSRGTSTRRVAPVNPILGPLRPRTPAEMIFTGHRAFEKNHQPRLGDFNDTFDPLKRLGSSDFTAIECCSRMKEYNGRNEKSRD